MKILYISCSKVPSKQANSVHVMKMCEAFAKAEHEIVLIARKGSFKCKDKLKYYGVQKKFKIKKLSFFGGLIEKFSYLISLVGFIFKRSKNFDYDIVYTRFLYAGWLLAKFNLPFIYESHQPPRGKMAHSVEDCILKSDKLIRVVVISQALKDIYLDIYPDVNENKIIVAHDGANIDEGEESRSTREKRDMKNGMKAGYFGNLYRGRGFELILEIAKRLPEIEFHIVGGGEKEIQKRQSFPDNVFSHGFIPHARVHSQMKKMDILLAPYQRKVALKRGTEDTSKWMSPLKIFEYMACGKAIVCSDLPVLKEVFENQKTALLCDPGDVDGWVKAITTLKEEKARDVLGANARSELEKKYTWDARTKKVLGC